MENVGAIKSKYGFVYLVNNCGTTSTQFNPFLKRIRCGALFGLKESAGGFLKERGLLH